MIRTPFISSTIKYSITQLGPNIREQEASTNTIAINKLKD